MVVMGVVELDFGLGREGGVLTEDHVRRQFH
jgi:hypothetical protein